MEGHKTLGQNLNGLCTQEVSPAKYHVSSHSEKRAPPPPPRFFLKIMFQALANRRGNKRRRSKTGSTRFAGLDVALRLAFGFCPPQGELADGSEVAIKASAESFSDFSMRPKGNPKGSSCLMAFWTDLFSLGFGELQRHMDAKTCSQALRAFKPCLTVQLSGRSHMALAMLFAWTCHLAGGKVQFPDLELGMLQANRRAPWYICSSLRSASF